jgi:hypothetical protein
MQEYLFQSKESKNLLKLFKDNDNVVWIKECCIDDSEPKIITELFRIIKAAFDAAKNTGAIYFSQIVKKEEWEEFFKLDNRWNLIEIISDTEYHIQCNINVADNCIIDQFKGKKQNEYFFEDKDSENLVKLFKDRDNIVWIEKYYVDKTNKDSILKFCDMLKKAFEIAQKEGGEYHSQHVNKEEWEEFLNSDERWELIEKLKDDIVHIQCDINDAAGCIIDGFIGFHENDNDSETKNEI